MLWRASFNIRVFLDAVAKYDAKGTLEISSVSGQMPGLY